MNTWKRKFFTVWTGQAISLLGSGLVQFALVWWLTLQTGSAAVLAGATLAALLPEVFDSAFAGATLVMVGLFAAGWIQPWHVYIILFLRAVGSAFHFPAMQASTSLMVPPEQMARIAGLNQLLRGVLNVATPPLGALLIALLPMSAVVAVDVLTA